MARSFDPASLFERRKRGHRAPQAYRSQSALEAAVVARTKALSVNWPAMRDLADWLPEVIRVAVRGDLAVVISRAGRRQPRKELQGMHLYQLPIEEMWRIPAIAALDQTPGFGDGWGLAGESQQSALFGYTPEQRAEWLAYQRDFRPGGLGNTVYTLLDAERRRSVESVGKRCFGPLPDDLAIFWHPWRPNVKCTAFGRIPRGLTFARFAVDVPITKALFGYADYARKPQLDRTVITRRRMRVLSKGLRSNVQFLTRTGWK